jgi:hypothetical protein
MWCESEAATGKLHIKRALSCEVSSAQASYQDMHSQEIAFRWYGACVDSDVQLYGNFEMRRRLIRFWLFAALLVYSTVPCLFVIAVGQASDQEALVTTAQTSEWHRHGPFAAR